MDEPPIIVIFEGGPVDGHIEQFSHDLVGNCESIILTAETLANCGMMSESQAADYLFANPDEQYDWESTSKTETGALEMRYFIHKRYDGGALVLAD